MTARNRLRRLATIRILDEARTLEPRDEITPQEVARLRTPAVVDFWRRPYSPLGAFLGQRGRW